jgi:O-acetyl-ADP-ribose deacetylase
MKRVEILLGDITILEVDAIVNAANPSLMGGGGVDGAIHRAGGPRILEECKQIRAKQGECKTGQSVITSAGNIKANYVIHTVGPVWKGGNDNEDALLASAYQNTLLLADEYDVTTIAFPNISTGVYHFPKGRAAEIALREVRLFLQHNTRMRKVIFCCFDEENFKIYKSMLDNS